MGISSGKTHIVSWIAAILMLFIFVPVVFGQTSMYQDFSQVRGIFWINRSHKNSFEPAIPDQILTYRDDEEYITDLLELARQWFSGMIYGYEFEYAPSDLRRQVDERFVLTPVFQIPRGTEGLEYTGYYEEDDKIEMGFRYLTKEFEQRRLRNWRSIRLVNIEGGASARDRNDISSREASFNTAVKEAIRNHYRQVLENKPRLITGRIALSEMPNSVAEGGLVFTSVRIIIEAGEIEQWTEF